MKPGLHTARVGFIRHGLTRWNVQKRIQGRRDLPLSAEGRKQVQRWAAALSNYHWDRIVSSDLERAIETAAILNRTLRVPMATDARLREQDWGRWEGQTMAHIRQQEPQHLALEATAGWDFAPPGGESRLQVFHRALAAVTDIIKDADRQQVLVVAHEGITKCLYYRLALNVLKQPDPPLMRFYGLHWFIFRGGRVHRLEANALDLNDAG